MTDTQLMRHGPSRASHSTDSRVAKKFERNARHLPAEALKAKIRVVGGW